MKHYTVVTLLAILSAAAGCGAGGPSAPSATSDANIPLPGTPNSVVLTNNVFTPTTLTTTVGSTVTWTWNSCSTTGGGAYGGTSSTGCVSHTVTFDDGGLNSVSQASGTATRKFTAAGSYPYHCLIHGTAMSGVVVVQ